MESRVTPGRMVPSSGGVANSLAIEAGRQSRLIGTVLTADSRVDFFAVPPGRRVLQLSDERSGADITAEDTQLGAVMQVGSVAEVGCDRT
jgi:hypothetical protein